MKVGIQCSSYGQRCGISTYAERLEKALKNAGVEAHIFINAPHEQVDVISYQYEPGILHPNKLYDFARKYIDELAVVTAHHSRGLDSVYAILDGVVFHDKSQITEDVWQGSYRIIPHPALVFPRKDKYKLRKKYGLPEDKTIIGTAGFITGTGKMLPLVFDNILKYLEDDMFLYSITSMWKGGDLGRYAQIMNTVKKHGKLHQFRIDTEFVDEETLNEKMQACDLLFAWNITGPNDIGSQSGIAADMYGSYTRLIVKDSPHYSFIGKQDKVLVGPQDPNEFAKYVIYVAKNEDLDDVQDPTWLSWDNQVKNYIDFFEELLE